MSGTKFLALGQKGVIFHCNFVIPLGKQPTVLRTQIINHMQIAFNSLSPRPEGQGDLSFLLLSLSVPLSMTKAQLSYGRRTVPLRSWTCFSCSSPSHSLPCMERGRDGDMWNLLIPFPWPVKNHFLFSPHFLSHLLGWSNSLSLGQMENEKPRTFLSGEEELLVQLPYPCPKW